jgi:hypothetical protein
VLRKNKPAQAFYEKLGGVIIGEKTDKRPDATLVEHAYGWRELSSLGSYRAAGQEFPLMHVGFAGDRQSGVEGQLPAPGGKYLWLFGRYYRGLTGLVALVGWP